MSNSKPVAAGSSNPAEEIEKAAVTDSTVQKSTPDNTSEQPESAPENRILTGHKDVKKGTIIQVKVDDTVDADGGKNFQKKTMNVTSQVAGVLTKHIAKKDGLEKGTKPKERNSQPRCGRRGNSLPGRKFQMLGKRKGRL